jgi:hypothetical protein
MPYMNKIDVWHRMTEGNPFRPSRYFLLKDFTKSPTRSLEKATMDETLNQAVTIGLKTIVINVLNSLSIVS